MRSNTRIKSALIKAVRAFVIAACVFLVSDFSGQAQTAGQVEAALEILKDVDADDLTWKSVELVAGAPAKARESVAAAVVQAVALLRVESTPACVGAIAAQVPTCAMSALASGLDHAPGYKIVTCVAVGSLEGVDWKNVEAVAVASAHNNDEARKIQAVLKEIRKKSK